MLELSLKALQVVLGLAAVALAGTTLASLTGSSAPNETPSPINAGPVHPSDASLPHYRVIADRNLFKLKEKPVAAPVEEVIVESKLQVQLVGTLVQEDSASGVPAQKSLALVRDTNGQVVTLAVGDAFAADRAKLVKIEPRRIVLEQGGKLEAVLLDEASETAAAPKPSLPAQIPAGMVADVARNMAQSSGPDAAMMQVFRQLGSQMVGSVERDANGRLSGFRIQRINEASALQGVGLQPGDTIRGINGQNLSADGAVVQLFSAFSGGADTRLTVQDSSGRARDLVLPRAVLQRMMTVR